LIKNLFLNLKSIKGHAIVDGLTGIIDIPFYHVYNLFGYWPFSKSLALYWASYDNNINLITSLHMLYASYARLRSLYDPNNYRDEFLMKRPYLVMLCLWIFGLTVWIPITLSYGVIDYSLEINFEPFYLYSIFNLFSWALPLIMIFFLSIYIYCLLQLRKNYSKKYYLNKNLTKNNVRFTNSKMVWPSSLIMDTNFAMPELTSQAYYLSLPRNEYIKIKILNYLKNFRLRAPGRFLIIMGSYWIQWSLPCFLKIVSSFLEKGTIPENLTATVYWSVYLSFM
jgi:hypothetical protein